MKIIRTASLSVLFFLAFISSAASAIFLDQLVIWVKTADVSRAGTDANLYLIINWKVPREGTGYGHIYKLPNLRGNDTERGKTDKFVIKILDDINIHEISGLTLVNGMNKKGPAWRLETIRIAARIRTEIGLQYYSTYFWLTDGDASGAAPVPINKWLDTKKNRSPAIGIPYKLRKNASTPPKEQELWEYFTNAVPLRGQ